MATQERSERNAAYFDALLARRPQLCCPFFLHFLRFDSRAAYFTGAEVAGKCAYEKPGSLPGFRPETSVIFRGPRFAF